MVENYFKGDHNYIFQEYLLTGPTKSHGLATLYLNSILDYFEGLCRMLYWPILVAGILPGVKVGVKVAFYYSENREYRDFHRKLYIQTYPELLHIILCDWGVGHPFGIPNLFLIYDCFWHIPLTSPDTIF